MESLTEYKARAYDLIVLIQQAQMELEKVNQKIIELSKPINEVKQ